MVWKKWLRQSPTPTDDVIDKIRTEAFEAGFRFGYARAKEELQAATDTAIDRLAELEAAAQAVRTELTRWRTFNGVDKAERDPEPGRDPPPRLS